MTLAKVYLLLVALVAAGVGAPMACADPVRALHRMISDRLSRVDTPRQLSTLAPAPARQQLQQPHTDQYNYNDYQEHGEPDYPAVAATLIEQNFTEPSHIQKYVSSKGWALNVGTESDSTERSSEIWEELSPSDGSLVSRTELRSMGKIVSGQTKASPATVIPSTSQPFQHSTSMAKTKMYAHRKAQEHNNNEDGSDLGTILSVLLQKKTTEAMTDSSVTPGHKTNWSLSHKTAITSTTSAISLFATTIAPTTVAPDESLQATALRSHYNGASFIDVGNEIPSVSLEANEIEYEQETSSSDKVLAFQLSEVNLGPPERQPPHFFVPPIVRRPYRRRVSLIGGGRARNQPSLGDRLAKQIRQQLAQLEVQEVATLSLPSTGQVAPAAATYSHPFIPTLPTTTDQPYRHPFIPSPPTTTSQPYQHPFIPSPPPTSAVPYQHPSIPVPPETTREPLAAAAEAPSIATIGTAAEAAKPLKHPAYVVPRAPRIPEISRQQQTLANSQPPAWRAPNKLRKRPPPPAATIVHHEEKVEAGFIVGEYGELGGGGTVRGVKYAADSSVDRSLLEAALQQFLRL